MKTLIITIIAHIFLCTQVFAENDYSSFYKKYKGEPGVINFKVPAFILKLMVDDEDEEVKNLLKKTESVSFLITNNPNSGILKELNSYLPKERYKNVMKINDGSSTILFKAREYDSGIDEILMTVSDSSNSLVIMSIDGGFSFDEVKAIIHSINTDNIREMH